MAAPNTTSLGFSRNAAVKMISALILALAFVPEAAVAGPPYLTDDPEPTDTGHWEIYAPVVEAAGKGSEFEGSVAAEINYGAAPGLQLSLATPMAFAHDAHGWHSGVGDLELGVKYRFFHDEDVGVSLAAFPSMTLPTASHGMGNSKVTALLPVWGQKDWGPWSVFGGGGYAINPGPGNRDFWSGGIAVTRQVSHRVQLGAELNRQGADTVGGHGATSLGAGAIVQIDRVFRVLLSGGPTFADREKSAGFHCFAALGLNL